MKVFFIGVTILAVLAGALVLWSRSLSDAPAASPDTGVFRFGFIRSIEEGDRTVFEFDDARWLMGIEGEDAAIRAGLCTESTRSECLPNDFFIENSATNTERFSFAETPVIALYTLKAETEGILETNVSLKEFATLLRETNSQWLQVPYQFLIEDGVVTILEEVYIP